MEAEKGHSKNILQIRKKCLESISSRQIAFGKFVKSREQFQILVLLFMN